MKSIVAEKAFRFAIKIVTTYQKISTERKEFVLTKQLLRSGTSIGANCQEATQASSKRDFVYKFTISLKEAQETHYWLRLMKETGYLENEDFQHLEKDCIEIIKMLTTSIITAKKSIENNK